MIALGFWILFAGVITTEPASASDSVFCLSQSLRTIFSVADVAVSVHASLSRAALGVKLSACVEESGTPSHDGFVLMLIDVLSCVVVSVSTFGSFRPTSTVAWSKGFFACWFVVLCNFDCVLPHVISTLALQSAAALAEVLTGVAIEDGVVVSVFVAGAGCASAAHVGLRALAS